MFFKLRLLLLAAGVGIKTCFDQLASSRQTSGTHMKAVRHMAIMGIISGAKHCSTEECFDMRRYVQRVYQQQSFTCGHHSDTFVMMILPSYRCAPG